MSRTPLGEVNETAIFKSEAGARAVHDLYRQLLAEWSVPYEGVIVDTREGDTFVVTCGRPDAPALVLLHGSGATAGMWIHDVETWSQHFRVLAIDMLGEPGLSARTRPALASDAHASWLDDVLDGLGVAKTSIVGVSLGGWLGLDYATRRPGRVERLAVLCPAGVGRQRVGFIAVAAVLMPLGAWGRTRLLQYALGPAAEGYIARDSKLGALTEAVGRHFTPRRERIPRFTDDALDRLTMPVLALVGERDTLLDSAGTKERLERHLHLGRVVMLPDVGHLIVDQTVTVLEFLRG